MYKEGRSSILGEGQIKSTISLRMIYDIVHTFYYLIDL